MNTVYNPLTGEWERLDDVVRPFPVIARDTRLVAVNNTTSFVPSLGSTHSPAHTDIFGNTNGERATISLDVGSVNADVVIPDPWRIRRFVVVCNRSGSGATNVAIACTVYARLLEPNGSPASGWRQIFGASDGSINYNAPIRLVLPATLSGVLGYDQYRITFRREQTSDPAPELSLIRVYAEF